MWVGVSNANKCQFFGTGNRSRNWTKCYNGIMKNLLAKEKILYDTVANSLSDKDFFIGFHAYFTFILGDGDKVIIDQIAEKFISRIEEEKSIEAIQNYLMS